MCPGERGRGAKGMQSIGPNPEWAQTLILIHMQQIKYHNNNRILVKKKKKKVHGNKRGNWKFENKKHNNQNKKCLKWAQHQIGDDRRKNR